MQKLCFKIQTLNINEKTDSKLSVKFIDPHTPKQLIKLECGATDDNTEWKIDIDETITQMITNITTLQIFDVVANKDGSINETLLGTTSIDLTDFLYGATEISFENSIQSVEDKNKIGTMTYISTITAPIFSDNEIDCNNFLNIEINEMKNIPKTWVDVLNTSNNSVNDKKKSKGKQQPPPKHWLECNCKLFEKDTPSFNVNILYNDSPKIMTSEKKNNEDEKDENDENKYYLDWNFDSKYLLSESCMVDIKELTNSTIKITHKYEEMDENEEVKIVDDPNYLTGTIDIQLLFNNAQSTQCVKLIFDDMKNENIYMENENISTVEIVLSFHKSFKQYFNEINSKINFKDTIMKHIPQNNEQKDTESIDGNNDLKTDKCVNDIINILVNEHIKFMENTSVQQYDNARMKQAFVYHLNSTGIYGEIKDKLIKPTISEYIDEMPLNTMYEQFLGSMISDLSNNVTNNVYNDDNSLSSDMINSTICVTKHSEIANDFEIQKMISNAYNHCKMAFDLTKELNIDFHWNSVQNLIKILIKQKQINEATSILTDVISNQSNQTIKNENLLFLSAILIENNHENAKCVIYELCDQSSQPLNAISLMLKAAFFTMNNDEKRSAINFQKAINLLNMQTDSNESNQFQQWFSILFELKCVQIISIILNMFEKFGQIDINFHMNHAKLNLETKNYDTAIVSINEALQIDDELPELFAIKGHIQFESNKENKAKESYIKHLELLPKQPDKLSLYRLGKMYQDEKEYELSLQIFCDAIIYFPESYLFWSETGDSLFYSNRYLECIQCFKQSNLIYNNNNHSWCMLAICYLKLNQPNKAIKIMKQAIKFDINNINDNDQNQIQKFGEKLCNIGYIENGKLFQNFIGV